MNAGCKIIKKVDQYERFTIESSATGSTVWVAGSTLRFWVKADILEVVICLTGRY